MRRLCSSLILDERGAWVTKEFSKDVYLGEPSNLVRIFNEMQADELSVTWLGRDKRQRDYFLRLISEQASMPLTYSGGVATLKEAKTISNMGFEKLAFNTGFHKEPNLLKRVTDEIGRSSVSLKLPIKKVGTTYLLWNWVSKTATNRTFDNLLQSLDSTSFGELIVTSVDKNGTGMGPDFELVGKCLDFKGVLLGYEGGVSSEGDIYLLWEKGVSVVLSGRFLACYGQMNAALIGYPNLDRKIV